ASVDITLPVTLDASILNGTTLVNTARATADEASTPVSDDGSFVVANDVDVAIEKTAGKARVIAGETLSYTLVVTNAGPSVARLVPVSDPLPPGPTFVSAPDPCPLVAAIVRCPLGTLASGDRRELTLTVRVDPGATGSVDNAVTVATISQDRDPANN